MTIARPLGKRTRNEVPESRMAFFKVLLTTLLLATAVHWNDRGRYTRADIYRIYRTNSYRKKGNKKEAVFDYQQIAPNLMRRKEARQGKRMGQEC